MSADKVPHLFAAVGAAGALVMILCAAGSKALSRLNVQLLQPERVAVAFALGAGVTSTLLLVVSVVFGLHPIVIASTLAAIAIVSRRELHSLLMECLGLLRASRGLRGWMAAGVLAAAAVVGVMLLQALGPTTDWDSLMYHLRIPEQWIARGRLYVPEDNLHVAFVGVVHMLYLPLLMLGSREAPAVFSVGGFLLLGLATFSLGRRLASVRAGAMAVAGLAGTGVVVLTAVTAKVDVTFTLFAFLSTSVLTLSPPGTDAKQQLRLSAALLGFAFGVKYFALPYAIAAAPIVSWAVWRTTASATGRMRILAEYAAIALLAALPWLLKNVLLLGAPLYPLFAAPRVDPWIATLYGSTAVPAGVPISALAVLEHAREPFNIMDVLLRPGRLTPEGQGRWYFLSPLMLYLPLAFIGLRRHVGLLLGTAIVFVLLVALRGYINLRYLMAAVPLLCVVASVGLDRVLSTLRVRTAGFAGALLVVLCAAPGVIAVGVHARSSAGPLMARERGEVPAEGMDGSGEGALYHRMVRAVNALTGPEARVILLFEGRGLLFDADVLQDNVLETWPMLMPAAAMGCLERSRASHVLLNKSALAYYKSRGGRVEDLGLVELESFKARCLGLVMETPEYALYRF